MSRKLEHLFDLSFSIDADGSISLEQSFGCGEVAYITLHPAQLRLLAERAGLMDAPTSLDAPQLHRSFARHVRGLVERFNEFYLEGPYFEEILERCSRGPEIALHLRAICDLGEETIGELALLEVSEESGSSTLPHASRDDKSAPGISVTSTPAKRGRPATGNAMTGAERQQRHREKQTALALGAPQ
ncbi:hypothetical protein [Niveibacterium sp.]|uniref:hypothetical protein n=1 Tax=Niveibacterium sp. TaxID=2017444 RepID=UPI0035B09AF6